MEENEKFVRDGFQDSDDEELDDDDDAEDDMGDEMKAKAGADEDSDDDDSDFEENAGEYALYDSPLEDTDELITIKQTFDEIFQADQSAYQYITSA